MAGIHPGLVLGIDLSIWCASLVSLAFLADTVRLDKGPATYTYANLLKMYGKGSYDVDMDIALISLLGTLMYVDEPRSKTSSV